MESVANMKNNVSYFNVVITLIWVLHTLPSHEWAVHKCCFLSTSFIVYLFISALTASFCYHATFLDSINTMLS